MTWKAGQSGNPGSQLHNRLAKAAWHEETFCAVSGLRYSPLSQTSRSDCAIGDSFGLIAPMAGNGMSIAFESAEIASPYMLAYARGELSWQEASDFIADACSHRLRRRLQLARLLQNFVFLPKFSCRLIPAISRSRAITNFLFHSTR